MSTDMSGQTKREQFILRRRSSLNKLDGSRRSSVSESPLPYTPSPTKSPGQSACLVTSVESGLSVADNQIKTIQSKLAASRGKIQVAQDELQRLNIIAARSIGGPAGEDVEYRNKALEEQFDTLTNANAELKNRLQEAHLNMATMEQSDVPVDVEVARLKEKTNEAIQNAELERMKASNLADEKDNLQTQLNRLMEKNKELMKYQELYLKVQALELSP